MKDFNSNIFKFTPHEIKSNLLDDKDINRGKVNDDEVILDKFLDHLNLINDFRERIKAIDYLISNAEKLSGNIEYTTNNQKIKDAIKDLGGTGNKVDFNLFKIAINEMILSYKQMALVSLTNGYNND